MGFLDFLSRKVQRLDTLTKKLELHPKEWINTEPISTTDLKKKVVLLKFCSMKSENKQSTHQLNLWNQMFPKDSFRLIAIYNTTDKKSLRLFLNNLDANFPVMIDDNHQTEDIYKANTRPSFYLFDKNSRVRHRILNDDDNERIGAAIMTLVSQNSNQ